MKKAKFVLNVQDLWTHYAVDLEMFMKGILISMAILLSDEGEPKLLV